MGVLRASLCFPGKDANCRKSSHRSLRPRCRPWLDSANKAIGVLLVLEGRWRCRGRGSLSFPPSTGGVAVTLQAAPRQRLVSWVESRLVAFPRTEGGLGGS